jgi:hypothetical protein
MMSSNNSSLTTTRLSPSVHSLVERKMASPTDVPPPVPAKTEDAPPLYQRTDTGPSITPVSMPIPRPVPPTSQISASAYESLVPIRSRTQGAQGPLHSGPSVGEISIPFYSNPPPDPNDPALELDKKLMIDTSANGMSGPSNPTSNTPEFSADSSSGEKKSSKFACLTLLSNDKLASTNFSPDMVHSINEVIRQTWAKGIAKHAYEDEYWGWQLEGKPCAYSSQPEEGNLS